jgi:hypothetical protein
MKLVANTTGTYPSNEFKKLDEINFQCEIHSMSSSLLSLFAETNRKSRTIKDFSHETQGKRHNLFVYQDMIKKIVHPI